MDERTVEGIMSVIEGLDIENIALKAYLKTCPEPLEDAEVDRLIEEAKTMHGVRERVSARWQQLRVRLQSDKTLEEAISKFAKIVPPPTKVN